MVAFEDVGAADPELAFFACGDFGLGAGRYDFEGHGWVEFAH